MQRAETVLRHWANTAGPKARTRDPSPDREYRRIKRAVLTGDTALLNSYGGVTAAPKRAIELQPLLEDRSVKLVIDDYRAWRARRFLGTRFGRAKGGSRADPGV